MTVPPIPKEIALRIGLAVRELPDTDLNRLLRVLEDAIGLPPTERTLSTLKRKQLKNALDGEFAHMDDNVLQSALEYLKGERGEPADPPPPTEAYSDGEMPGSIRVACGSNGGERLDGHFGSCRRFLIYQVSADESRLVDVRAVGSDTEVEDKNAYRATLIEDCQLLFVSSIGGPAAAKVIKVGVHPIKKPMPAEAREEMQRLQAVIGPDAPPWLAKVMGQPPEARIRFERRANV